MLPKMGSEPLHEFVVTQRRGQSVRNRSRYRRNELAVDPENEGQGAWRPTKRFGHRVQERENALDQSEVLRRR